MLRGLWGRQSANKRSYFCRERTFALFSDFPPTPPLPPNPPPPPGCGRKCCGRERWYTPLVPFFRTLTCSEAKNRHKLMFFDVYISQDLDSENVFHGIGIFCRFFALKDFLSYRPLITVWADPPTAVRFRVKSEISRFRSDRSICVALSADKT
jgi:hypothetical protein